MLETLAGKCAIVSGASKGIGKAVALRLAREGADVALLARSTDALEVVADEITSMGRRAEAVPGDLRSLEGCRISARQARAALGAVDIFVHCAGATKGGLFVELEDDIWMDGFALKFNAAVRLTRELWPSLVASKGTVVHIVGGAARTPDPDYMIGGAVNAALANFAKALAGLGKRDDVNVNVVSPGMTMTERLTEILGTEAARTGESLPEVEARKIKAEGIRRLGRPEDVAALVAFLCSPGARHIQGVAISVDGGATPGVY
ncbi:MAG: SDR family NAD(P)-dependent oxidoreductase [Alphaproteobacteria bacterium]